MTLSPPDGRDCDSGRSSLTADLKFPEDLPAISPSSALSVSASKQSPKIHGNASTIFSYLSSFSSSASSPSCFHRLMRKSYREWASPATLATYFLVPDLVTHFHIFIVTLYCHVATGLDHIHTSWAQQWHKDQTKKRTREGPIKKEKQWQGPRRERSTTMTYYTLDRLKVARGTQ